MYDIQFASSTVLEEGRKPDLDRVFKAIAEAGFAGVELDAAWIEEDAGVTEVRDLCYKHQIAPVSAVVRAAGEKGLAYAVRIQDHLDILGAEHLVLSDDVNYSNPSSVEADSVQTLIHSLAASSADLGLKISYASPVYRLNEESVLAELLTATPAETVGLSLDFQSLLDSNVDLIDILQKWGDRCNYLVFSSLSDELLSALERALNEVGFAGWAVLKSQSQALSASRADLEKLRTLFNA